MNKKSRIVEITLWWKVDRFGLMFSNIWKMKTLQSLIKNYCLENIYAPQSPTSILEFAKQKYLENQPQAELEFEKVVELNKRYSLRINEDTIMAKIESEITRSVLKAFRNDFIELGDWNREQVKKRFITQFNSLLKANSVEQTNGLIGIEKK